MPEGQRGGIGNEESVSGRPHFYLFFVFFLLLQPALGRTSPPPSWAPLWRVLIDVVASALFLSLSVHFHPCLSLPVLPRSTTTAIRIQNVAWPLCVCVCVWGFRSMAFHRSPAGSVDFAWRKKRIRLLSRSSAPSSTSRSTGRIAHRTSMASPGNNTPSIRSPLEREMTTTTRTVNQVDTGKTTSWSGLLAVGQLT